jgi:hypothetical protein
MLAQFVALLAGIFMGFNFNIKIQLDQTHEMSLLEKKIALLERENDQLRDANQQWFEASENHASEKKSIETHHEEMQRGFCLCLTILGCIILMNCGIIYFNLIMKNSVF